MVARNSESYAAMDGRVPVSVMRWASSLEASRCDQRFVSSLQSL